MDLARPIRSFVIRQLSDSERRKARRRKAEEARQKAGKPHEVLYFHQVDDPYSRLAAQVLEAFLQRYEVELRFLPVAEPPPVAIHDVQMWNDWAERDAAAIAPYYGLAYRTASAAPSTGQLQIAQRILCRPRDLAEQARLAVALGEALAARDDSRLQQLAGQHGSTDEATAAGILSTNGRLRHKLGHYLGGMFHYAGEWYWGIDRLHYLEERLHALGARRPGAPEGPSVRLQRRAPEHIASGQRVTLEYFPSLRSPYTHLSYERVADLCRRYPVDLVVRPVLPMMMRGVKADRRKAQYIVKDAKREAERLGIAFGNTWDPFGKPVLRAYSLFPWARDQGRGFEYLHAYSDAVWARRVNAWRKDGLRQIVERAGLNWNEAERRLDNRDWEAELENNVQDMLAHGAWGVPTFHLPAAGGHGAFTAWGQDRIWRVEEEIARRLDAC